MYAACPTDRFILYVDFADFDQALSADCRCNDVPKSCVLFHYRNLVSGLCSASIHFIGGVVTTGFAVCDVMRFLSPTDNFVLFILI